MFEVTGCCIDSEVGVIVTTMVKPDVTVEVSEDGDGVSVEDRNCDAKIVIKFIL